MRWTEPDCHFVIQHWKACPWQVIILHLCCRVAGRPAHPDIRLPAAWRIHSSPDSPFHHEDRKHCRSDLWPTGLLILQSRSILTLHSFSCTSSCWSWRRRWAGRWPSRNQAWCWMTRLTCRTPRGCRLLASTTAASIVLRSRPDGRDHPSTAAEIRSRRTAGPLSVTHTPLG